MRYAEVADSPDSNAFTNYFNVESKDNHYVLLANKTLTVLGSENANPGTYSEHVFSLGDHWSSLSYRYFGTTSLWWAICKFNAISNPFILPKVGEIIKIPAQSVIDLMLNEIKSDR